MSTTAAGLNKAPFNVVQVISSLLAPSELYNLRQVNRDFRDAVQRHTENYRLPFVWCRLEKELALGCFDFVDTRLRTIDPARTPAPPQLRVRGGKAYYRGVSEEEVGLVVSALFAEYAVDMARSLLFSPMPSLNVVVSSDDVKLHETLLHVMNFAFVRFAPAIFARADELKVLLMSAQEQEQKQHKPVHGDFEKIVADIMESTLAELKRDVIEPPSGQVPKLHQHMALGDKIFEGIPKRLVVLLIPLVKSAVDKPGYGSRSFSEVDMKRSLLSAAYLVSSPTSAGDAAAARAAAADGVVLATSARDAADMLRRPHIFHLFSRSGHPEALLALASECNIESHKISVCKEQIAATTTTKFQSDAERRFFIRENLFGVSASASLQRALEEICDKGGEVSAAPVWLPCMSSPQFLHTMKWDGAEDEQNRYDHRVFKFLTGKGVGCWGPVPTSFLVDNIFKSPGDTVLVGENSEGEPIRLQVQKLHEFFKASQITFTGLVKQSSSSPGLGYDHHKFILSRSALGPPEQQQVVPRCPLYVADDVSLGVIYNETLYEPSEIVAQKPWRNKDNVRDQSLPDKFARIEEEMLSPRLLTPWLLLGEAGTYSDEHQEPSDTHVWVHLFCGRKLWFVQLTEHELKQGATVGKKSLDEYKKQVCLTEDGWCHFEQAPCETVIMPPRVRHFVINQEPSVAVARNFVGSL